MKISSFDQLAEYLKTFSTWDDRGGYDFGGMVHLLGACLDNLQNNAQHAELQELAEHLEPNQIAFLEKLSQRIRR